MSKDKRVVRDHIVIDNKKLEKLRKKLTKTIDDFKLSVLDSLEASQDGPLKEGLRPIELIVQEEAQSVAAIPVITQQTGVISAEELQQWVAQDKQALRAPALMDSIDAPYADVGLSLQQKAQLNLKPSLSVEPVVEAAVQLPVEPIPLVLGSAPMIKLIDNIDYAPYADVTEKVQTVLHARGAHVFFAGFDNLVNSNVRNFLQRRGARTFLPALEGQATKSIIEQFEFFSDIEFAVVVLSPDEFLFQKIQDPKNAMLVASQKIVYELGYLVGKLGRNRVVAFYEEVEGFKRPTEYFDLSYIPFDAEGYWQQRLIGQMRVGGIVFNEEKVAVV